MVDTAMSRAGRRARTAYVIEPMTDPAALRPLLESERAYAAYALGQLELRLFARSRWWAARPDGPVPGSDQGQAPSTGSGQGLVLHAQGGLGYALVTLGDPEAVDAILSLHPGPRFAFAMFKPEHLAAAKRHFLLSRELLMLRMAVTAEGFRPVEGLAGRDGAVVRLLGRDVARINRLYGSEGGPSNYSSRNIDEAVYYGVIVDGRLMSIAGTHVVSPSEGLAVVGNVFTHPKYRGRGLAAIATSAVTAHLLGECRQVLLTVETTNGPAIRVYEKLGYETQCTLYETQVMRKDPLGLLSLSRRLLSRWRGRRQGKEVMVL